MRGVTPPVLLLLLLLLALLILAGQPWLARRGEAVCGAPGIVVKVYSASEEQGMLIIEGVVQPSNPCYKVVGIGASLVALGQGVASVRLVVSYTRPPPGTVCIQVVPPPKPFTIRLHAGAPVRLVRLEVVLSANGSASSCTLLLPVRK